MLLTLWQMLTRSITEYYQFQSNVWAHMGIMRRRLIFEDINQLTIIWFTTRLTYINRNSSEKMTPFPILL